VKKTNHVSSMPQDAGEIGAARIAEIAQERQTFTMRAQPDTNE